MANPDLFQLSAPFVIADTWMVGDMKIAILLFLLIVSLNLLYASSGDIQKLDKTSIVDGLQLKIPDNVPSPLKDKVDLVITGVAFTRQEFTNNPDRYFLNFSVKNRGTLDSDPSHIGYDESWKADEGNLMSDVIKTDISLPSIPGGDTIFVKKSFQEQPDGKITICKIQVNAPYPGCNGNNCTPANEVNYNNNAWSKCYHIPDTKNSLLETESKLTEGNVLTY